MSAAAPAARLVRSCPQDGTCGRCARGSCGAGATRTRDRLSLRSAGLDRTHPEALDLEADAIDEAADELRGVAGLVAEASPIHARETLRGERHLHAAQICRWAISSRPEARAAASRWCRRVLAAAERRPPDADTPAAAADLARRSADVLASVTESLRGDGLVDSREAAEIAPLVARLQATAAQLSGLLDEIRSAGRAR